MTSKEVYDRAVANGLEFTYFHGEEECPEKWKGTKKEIFWEMEYECADKSISKPQFARDYYLRDLSDDAEELEELDFDENYKPQLRIPPFITNAKDKSEAAKIVAYDVYAELRYYSIGSEWAWNPNSMDDLANGNGSFDDYFLG